MGRGGEEEMGRGGEGEKGGRVSNHRVKGRGLFIQHSKSKIQNFFHRFCRVIFSHAQKNRGDASLIYLIDIQLNNILSASLR
jgi:hypothetical protein